jgi:hypothetical protein
MGWRCDSSGRAPALQAGNPSPTKKKKKEKKRKEKIMNVYILLLQNTPI